MVPLNVPDTVRFTAVAVPVSAGLAVSAFVATAVAILLNSVENSVPLIIFEGLPEGKESLVEKLVVTV
jgi:hypothetical protein